MHDIDPTSNCFCKIKTNISGGLTKQGWKNHELLMVWHRRSSNLLTVLVKLNTNMPLKYRGFSYEKHRKILYTVLIFAMKGDCDRTLWLISLRVHFPAA